MDDNLEATSEINIGRDAHNSIIISGNHNNARIFVYQYIDQAFTDRQISHQDNPYQGLRAFNEEDSNRFFGRTTEVEELWGQFASLHKSSKTRLLAVLGPSGSGKSSLVRAGLLSELCRQATIGYELQVVVFKPGRDVLSELAMVLARLITGEKSPVKQAVEFRNYLKERNEQGEYHGLDRIASSIEKIRQRPLLIVVDQFEEIYSYEPAEEELENHRIYNGDQKIFIETLLHAAKAKPRQVSVILTMRVDFLKESVSHERLNYLLCNRNHMSLVRSMSSPGRRDSIVEPTKRSEFSIDNATVEKLLSQSKDVTVALPLLQFTLETMFQQWVTQERPPAETLESIGGIGGSLSNVADKLYKSLTSQEQEIAKRIFIRLVCLGDDREKITKRRIRLAELSTKQISIDSIRRVVRKFSGQEEDNRENQRLLTLSTNFDKQTPVETVELVHETLFEWKLYKSWLQDHWDDLRFEQRLKEAAHLWKQKRSDVWRSIDLEKLREFYRDYTHGLGETELAFLKASEVADKRRKRNNYLAVGAILAFSVLASIAAVVASINGKQAQHARNNAEIRADTVFSRSLSSSGQNLDSLAASIKAVKRIQISGAPKEIPYETKVQAVMSLNRAVYKTIERNILESHAEGVTDIDISPDGNLISSSSSDGTIKIWNFSGQLLHTWTSPDSPEKNSIWDGIGSVAFSPDGKVLAFPVGQAIQLIDISGKPIEKIEWNGDVPPLCCLGIYSLQFSPNGESIAYATAANEARIVNLKNHSIDTFSHESTNLLIDISMSQHDRHIVTSDVNGVIKLWNRDTGNLIADFLHGKNDDGESIHGLEISPDGRIIVSVGADIWMNIWSSSGELLQQIEDINISSRSVTISPDSKLIATGSDGGVIKLWKTNGESVATLTGHSGAVNTLRFAPNGESIISGGADGTVRVWNIPLLTPKWKAHNAPVLDFEFTADREVLATASQDWTIKLWDKEYNLLDTLLGHSGPVSDISFDSTGNIIASTSRSVSPSFRLWNLREDKVKVVSENMLSRPTSVIFNPLSDSVISAGRLQFKLWSIKGEFISNLSELVEYTFSDVNISTDGKLLAVYQHPGTRVFREAPQLKIHNLDGDEMLPLFSLPGVQAAFSHKNDLIVTADRNGFIRFFDITGKLITRLTGQNENIRSITFSPDDRLIAYLEDEMLKLLSKDGSVLDSLDYLGSVQSYTFTPDGRNILIAVKNGSIINMSLDPQFLLGQGCDKIRDYLKSSSSISLQDRSLCDDIAIRKLDYNRELDWDAPHKEPNKGAANPKNVTESDVGYPMLVSLLELGELEAASEKTNQIISSLTADETKIESASTSSVPILSCTDLRDIDEIWSTVSNGRFGFRIQKAIYDDVEEDFDAFNVMTGKGYWTEEKKLLGEGTRQIWNRLPQKFNFEAPPGSLPAVQNISGADTRKALMTRLEQCDL